MNQLIKRLYSRAAMSLTLMERRAAAALFLIVLTLTAQTAWAVDITFLPAVKKSYMFTGKQIRPQIKYVICNGEEYTVEDSPLNSGDCAVVRYGKNVLNGTGNGSIICKLYHNGEVVLDDWTVFDILPREVTLVVDDCEKYYGDADPAFTCHFDPSTTAEVQVDTLYNWNRTLPKAYRHVEMTREAGESLGTYTINSTRTLPFEFLTPAMRVTAIVPGTMTVKPNPADFSVNEAGTEYTIHTATGWDVFCDALLDNDTYNRFSGKTVKLGANIEVSRMAGSQYHDFCGTFDGQGNTLTFSYTMTEGTERVAPFSYVSTTTPEGGTDLSPAVIHRLNVVSNITTNGEICGGIVGEAWGEVTIEHCTVSGTITTSNKYAGGIIGRVSSTPLDITDCRSSVTIRSSVEGDGTHGGIAGLLANGNNVALNIEGCLFDGKLLTVNTGEKATTNCGGFVGWRNNTLKISNSLYAPNMVEGETWIGNSESATFARNGIANTTISNCYYTADFNDGTHFTGQGKQALAITGGENVTVEVGLVGGATATEYTTTGITAYKDGDTQLPGILYNSTIYAGQGDQMGLTLQNTPPTGFFFSAYTATAGTLSGTENPYTLTIPDQDVEIDAAWGVTYLDEKGNTQVKQPGEYTLLEGGSSTVISTPGWYVAAGEISYNISNNEIALNFVADGDIHLILADGCQMNIGKKTWFIGIGIKHSGFLTIYGQSTGDDMGKLIINTKDQSNFCICARTLTINGGNIKAESKTSDGIYTDGNLTINGGIVNVKGDSYGTGFGIYSNNGNVTINGGNVTAIGTIDDGIYAYGSFTYNGGILTAISTNRYPIFANNGLTFNWTSPADSITFSPNTLFGDHNAGFTVTFKRLFIDADGNYYGGTLTEKDAFVSLNGKTLRGTTELVLSNAADNSANIAAANDMGSLGVQLSGRTLYKDGAWNTLCLPFDVVLAGSPLEGAIARTLSSASITGSTLNLTFSEPVDKLVAGTPYIIKWTADADYVDDDAHNIVSPVFSNVTVSAADNSYDNAVSGDLRVRFIGTYKSTMFQAEDKSILLMGADNQLFYPQPNGGQNPSLGAQRAYFKIGEDGSQQARQLTGFSITYDGEATTGIIEAEADSSLFTIHSSLSEWYSLDGRKLQGKPTKRGVYIFNGHKLMVK